MYHPAVSDTGKRKENLTPDCVTVVNILKIKTKNATCMSWIADAVFVSSVESVAGQRNSH